jgi:hypothetical protein
MTPIVDQISNDDSLTTHPSCVICLEDIPLENDLSDVKKEADDDEEEQQRATWNKVFECLLIPEERYHKLFKVCKKERFCPGCQKVFVKIGKLVRKAAGGQKTEDRIRNKVQTLGKAMLAAGVGPTTTPHSLQGKRVLRRFRRPALNSKYY